ncbi:exported hypothetical protein [Burkholderiales bacterium]|nr:exported hypothetical protein [Burkholderiales bacterium]
MRTIGSAFARRGRRAPVASSIACAGALVAPAARALPGSTSCLPPGSMNSSPNCAWQPGAGRIRQCRASPNAMGEPRIPARRGVRLFLCGDAMIGRGIDQVLAHPGSAQRFEPYVSSAPTYVERAETAHGAIARPVRNDYLWLPGRELADRVPAARGANHPSRSGRYELGRGAAGQGNPFAPAPGQHRRRLAACHVAPVGKCAGNCI